MTTGTYDPVVLVDLGRLVVATQRHHNLTAVDRDDRSAVSNICRVAHISHNKNNDGTRTRPVYNANFTVLVPRLTLLQERLFGLCEAANDGLARILWEAVLLDHEVMQLIAQELGARMASMTIVHAKEAALGPLLVLSVTWLCNVQYDGNAIFVVGAH